MPAALRTEPSDHLDGANFDRIAMLVGNTTGIKLPPQKRLMVESRLRRRFGAVGAAGISEYCHFLFDNGGLETELVHLIDAVTTNKTDFFREPDHMLLLEREMVPELLKSRRGGRPLLKAWSAASSTGAEAWSIAMVLQDIKTRRDTFEYAILGTDISTSVLTQARRAVYTADLVTPVPAALRSRYVMDGRGANKGQVRIAPELRRRVKFERMNLMDQTYPYDHDVDIIFLRNVLIYFERDDQEAVIERLVRHLRPKGYLVVGHSESMVVTSARLRQIGPAAFQKL